MISATNPTLVTVGDNCLDTYLDRDRLMVGGNALNVAVQWHRNGWPARYFGAVGFDAEGDLVLDAIAAAGLDVDDVERRAGDTAVTLLRGVGGDRRFLLEALGVGEGYVPSPARYAVAMAADWVHLGTNAAPALVRRLAADHVPFSVDVSTAHFRTPLAGVPLVFASGPDDPATPVEPLLRALHAAGAAEVVATCGGRGAYHYDGTTVSFMPAAPVDVVDTCGAGDSFIATFLTSHRIAGRPVGEALEAAAAAASLTCTHLGGFPQTPRPIPAWLPEKYAAWIGEGQRG